MKRVYRWECPIDDKDHRIACGMQVLPVAEVNRRLADGGGYRWSVSFWVVQDDDTTWSPGTYRVFGTGHSIPDDYVWRASAPRTDDLVFHLFEKAPVTRTADRPQAIG